MNPHEQIAVILAEWDREKLDKIRRVRLWRRQWIFDWKWCHGLRRAGRRLMCHWTHTLAYFVIGKPGYRYCVSCGRLRGAGC